MKFPIALLAMTKGNSINACATMAMLSPIMRSGIDAMNVAAAMTVSRNAASQDVMASLRIRNNGQSRTSDFYAHACSFYVLLSPLI